MLYEFQVDSIVVRHLYNSPTAKLEGIGTLTLNSEGKSLPSQHSISTQSIKYFFLVIKQWTVFHQNEGINQDRRLRFGVLKAGDPGHKRGKSNFQDNSEGKSQGDS